MAFSPATPVSQPGDIWQLGAHRLICGDSTDPSVVAALMAGDQASLCFTSPPYGQQRNYTQGIADWDALMRGVFANLPMASDGQVLVNLGLIHRAIELAPSYTDVAIKRFQQNHPDIPVTFLATGQTFAEVEAERQISSGNAPEETRSDPLSPDRRSGALA